VDEGGLRKLLGTAESDLERAPFVAVQMVHRVRDRHAARTRRRARLLQVGVPLAAACAVMVMWQLIPRPVAQSEKHGLANVATESGAVDIERLRAQAEFHSQLAHELMAVADRQRARGARAAARNREINREPLDLVAYRMILRADAILAAMESSEEAAVIYRQVVRLFPTTGSAELARQRLADKGFSEGDI
jgi:hypothetical protein